MINVLHYGLSSNLGGIETYNLKILRMIDKNQFHFIYLDDTEDGICIKDEAISLGAEVIKIHSRRKNWKKNIEDLKDVFKNKNIDILHIHLNTLSYISPINIALSFGCKVILHSRNAGCSLKLHTLLLHKFHQFYLRNKDITRIAVSTEAGNWLFGKEKKFAVINNGIEIEKFEYHESSKLSFRTAMNLENRQIILHVGAFLPAKNHEFLLNIFKEYLKFNENAVLLLVGEGPLLETIKNMANTLEITGNVIFLGKSKKMSEIYCASDCLLFPSLFEGFPNVVLESQTSGLPCLISDVITREVCVLDNCIQVNLKEKPIEWAKRLKVLLENNSSAQRSNCGQIIRDSGFSVNEEINKIEKLYQER